MAVRPPPVSSEAPQPLSPGERRTVKRADAEPFVAQIATARIVPRRSGRRSTPEAIHD